MCLASPLCFLTSSPPPTTQSLHCQRAGLVLIKPIFFSADSLGATGLEGFRTGVLGAKHLTCPGAPAFLASVLWP